jgi:hypothetical protein
MRHSHEDERDECHGNLYVYEYFVDGLFFLQLFIRVFAHILDEKSTGRIDTPFEI